MRRTLTAAGLLVFSATIAAAQQPPDARAMFYDPASTGAAAGPSPVRLRSIAFASPFPSRGYVGVHYWFEDPDGRPSTYSTASTGALSLHLRSNVDGYLSVWSIGGESDYGTALTPTEDVTGRGNLYGVIRSAAGHEHVVGGLSRIDGSRRVLFVFSRSQQEQVTSAWSAVNKLAAVRQRVTTNGPELVHSIENAKPGEIGTYVVNVAGNPAGAEVR